MVRIGEEIEEVERDQAPAGRNQPARVAGKGYRIAGEITNDLAGALRDRFDGVALRSRARRIEEDEVSARHVEVLHRGVDHLDVWWRVLARVSGGGSFDRDHTLEDPRQRKGEEADTGVEIDGHSLFAHARRVAADETKHGGEQMTIDLEEGGSRQAVRKLIDLDRQLALAGNE